jgi:hypothetical protein
MADYELTLRNSTLQYLSKQNGQNIIIFPSGFGRLYFHLYKDLDWLLHYNFIRHTNDGLLRCPCDLHAIPFPLTTPGVLQDIVDCAISFYFPRRTCATTTRHVTCSKGRHYSLDAMASERTKMRARAREILNKT